MKKLLSVVLTCVVLLLGGSPLKAQEAPVRSSNFLFDTGTVTSLSSYGDKLVENFLYFPSFAIKGRVIDRKSELVRVDFNSDNIADLEFRNSFNYPLPSLDCEVVYQYRRSPAFVPNWSLGNTLYWGDEIPPAHLIVPHSSFMIQGMSAQSTLGVAFISLLPLVNRNILNIYFSARVVAYGGLGFFVDVDIDGITDLWICGYDTSYYPPLGSIVSVSFFWVEW